MLGGGRGLLASLLVEGAQSFTTMTGAYTLVDASHLRVDGHCWQGYERYACSETYGFTLSGDRLTLLGSAPVGGQLDYRRLGPAAAVIPPTLVPPGPSATP